MAELADTIIAVSTASGVAPRAIVRLSGPQAFPLVQAAAPAGTDLAGQRPYSRLPALIELFDGTGVPAELYLMRGPYSYTREDVVEIHTFGSPVLLEMIVEDFIDRGARLAEAGEFTRRAFLNGRIDLVQAEAVLQVIRSRTGSELRLALRQLEGTFSDRVAGAREKLLQICTLAEASIDFSDQDIEIVTALELGERISQVRSMMAELEGAAQRREGGRPGISVAICGRPNVGKSSLLNALLGRNRSIVTHLPGTTRDAVDDLLEIHGHLFRISDTAGARDSDNAIEQEAVRRAARIAEAADLIVLVINLAEELTPHEIAFWKQIEGVARIAVLNKADLPSRAPAEELLAGLGHPPAATTSCTRGTGIEELKRLMAQTVRWGRIDSSAPSFLLNARHHAAIRRAVDGLDRARRAANDGLSTEFIALDLRVALDALGEIAGRTCTDDILDRIFSDFCIGK